MSKASDLASRVLAPLTGVLLFLQGVLIVTGGAVRLTGSGLGCPTWPECTTGSFTPVAHQAEPVLNVWIEFGNRLLGIVLGFITLLVVIAVLKCKRKDLRILAFGQLLGVIAQGILGGITVRTDLHPSFVAPHFLLSIILIPGAVSLYSRRHAPAVFVGEIAAHLPPGQRRRRSHVLIADGVMIDVMHTKQERVNGLPRKCQGCKLQYGCVFHGSARLSDID